MLISNSYFPEMSQNVAHLPIMRVALDGDTADDGVVAGQQQNRQRGDDPGQGSGGPDVPVLDGDYDAHGGDHERLHRDKRHRSLKICRATASRPA
jgi:hypothetical protein